MTKSQEKLTEGLDLFLDMFEKNVGSRPIALLLGPHEYFTLCAIDWPAEIKNLPEATLPLATHYKGIPVRCKRTRGCEPELTHSQALKFAVAEVQSALKTEETVPGPDGGAGISSGHP
jgi:hypothetical protein